MSQEVIEEEKGNLGISRAKITELYKLPETMEFPEIRKTEQMPSYKIRRGSKWRKGEAFLYNV